MQARNKELFDPNMIFTGDVELVLCGYPMRSKNLERYAEEGINVKELNQKFIKDGYMYLLRGSNDGQETGFYSRTYADGETMTSLKLDPNAVAFYQSMNGNTSFISATTDIYTAASFANKRIYILKIPVEDVYTFFEIDGLLEFEYMIPDYVLSSEIVKSFRFDKMKQIYNYLSLEVGLDITPEDLGTTKHDILFPDLDRIKLGSLFNNGPTIFDGLSEKFNDAFLEAKIKDNKRIKKKEKENKKTLREVAIFSDIHGLLEPTEAILKDISKRGITEIYSLGDNIGLGPNPSEVLCLLEDYNVKSLAGNYEEMIRLGNAPFMSYLSNEKIIDADWTKSQLSKGQLQKLNEYESFLNLEMAGKKIGLCHFANDIRCDFIDNNVWDYVEWINMGLGTNNQFKYTNSKNQLIEFAKVFGIDSSLIYNSESLEEGWNLIKSFINKNNLTISNNPEFAGYLSYLRNQLFVSNGKILTPKDYSVIIQGHTHFACHVNDEVSDVYSIRGVGIGYSEQEKNIAEYVILKEYIDKVDVEIIKVPYDRSRMEHSIKSSKNQNKLIRKYTKTI